MQLQRTRFPASGRDIHVIPRPLEVPSPRRRAPGRRTVVAPPTAEPSPAMSEAEEVERLKKDLDKCNSIIKVSVRE